jgi:hypothetical protein
MPRLIPVDIAKSSAFTIKQVVTLSLHAIQGMAIPLRGTSL